MKPSEIIAASIVLGILWAQTAGAQEPVFFSAGDSVRITGYFYSVQAEPKGLILAFHQGNANARGEYRHIAPRLAAHGYAVLAVDLRAGGELFQDRNQTVAALGASRPFCEAARDVQAAVAYAKANYPGLPIILWGSSYSAALVIRFVAADGRGIAAILAFSPASGERMTGCHAEDVSGQVRIPVLVLRPAAEAARPPGAGQLATFRAQGHAVHIATPGTHGASMLDPARVEGNVAPTWEAVMGFLARVADS